jgi:hypothetical protein
MEEEALMNTENLHMDDILPMLEDFPLLPTTNKVIITMNTSEEVSDDGVRISNNHLAESQYVLAAGSHVHAAKPGNKVLLNLEKMMVYEPGEQNTHERVGHIKIRPVEVNGRFFALVSDAVIDCVDFR